MSKRNRVRLKFNVGQRVVWASHANGHMTTKIGVVAAVLAPGEEPSKEAFPDIYAKSTPPGLSRNHESYIVMVKPTEKSRERAYWPIVSRLQLQGSHTLPIGEQLTENHPAA